MAPHPIQFSMEHRRLYYCVKFEGTFAKFVIKRYQRLTINTCALYYWLCKCQALPYGRGKPTSCLNTVVQYPCAGELINESIPEAIQVAHSQACHFLRFDKLSYIKALRPPFTLKRSREQVWHASYLTYLIRVICIFFLDRTCHNAVILNEVEK